MSNLKKVVIFLSILVIALPAAAFGYTYFKLNSIYDKNANTSLLDNVDYNSEKGITNILLVGIDARNLNERARSDSMMILTVDNKHKNLKLTSLARDTYVEIPGKGSEKLTHAYAYGGIDLLVETVEKNFELDIQNYAIVNFFSFMDIVDTLGGVTVDVQKNELTELNRYIEDCYALNKSPDKGPLEYVNSPGINTLNGYQALAFGRIRKNDDALERDRRQRAMIQGLIGSAKNLPLSKYPSLVDTILPYIKTDMKPTSIMSMGAKVLTFGDLSFKQLEFPPEEYSTGGIVGSDGWVWQYDEDKSLPILHDFIFNNIMYEKNK